MKRFRVCVLASVLVFLLAGNVFAESTVNPCPCEAVQSSVQTPKSNCEANDVIAALSEGQQGCCSWHGGVCGCNSGRVVCCDGSYSPTCRCRAGQVEIGE